MRADVASSAPRVVVGVLAAIVGVALLAVHLQLHPIALSARELRDLPPRHREVVLATDNAVVVDERADGVRIVAIDSGGPYLIYVEPGFEGARPETGGLHLFRAVYPGSAPETRWVPHRYQMDAMGEGTMEGPLLENVVWSAQPAPAAPPARLALAGVALLAASLVAFGPAYSWAGASAALGFGAGAAAGRAATWTPAIALWGVALVAAAAALAVALVAIARRRHRPHLATAATLLAFGVGLWAERALLAGYRPFTGIL